MKRILTSLTCLALASLACLQTVAAVAPESSMITANAVTAPATSAIQVAEPTLTKVGTAAAPACAVVSAYQSLHLRREANERAVVLAWLMHGDVVHVVPAGQLDNDWWFIEHEGVYGYARSKYLQASEC